MAAKFPTNLYLRALIYPEEGRYIAHCLEMDLIGIGPNPQKAFADLQDHIEMQVTFAHEQGDQGMLWHPAPKRLFDIFERRG